MIGNPGFDCWRHTLDLADTGEGLHAARRLSLSTTSTFCIEIRA
jgi:hypothetical protein